jgi:glycosyltransferase involved in cell wall biosynthesis
MNPLVSVIIPVYNKEKTVQEAIQSIINQTYKNIEIIVINDGSKDRSLEIISALNYNNITIINQKNQGNIKAKNNALRLINGDYIQFLDADDILSDDKIGNQVKLLEKNKDAIVWCDSYIFSNIVHNSIKIKTNELIKIKHPLEFLLYLNGITGSIFMIQPNAFLFSRHLLQKSGLYNENLIGSPDDDSDFYARLISNSSEVIYDAVSQNYYRETDSTNVSRQHSSLNISKLLDSIIYKFSYLVSKYDKYKIKIERVYLTQLLNFQYQFGYTNEINYTKTNRIINELHVIGKLPFVGGTKFKIASLFFGVKNLIHLKYIQHKTSIKIQLIINKYI